MRTDTPNPVRLEDYRPPDFLVETVDLDVSADPAFRGDPALVNPEQLVVVAASSCQLMSFLAAAALAHIDVVSYEDDAEGEMPEERPIRITRITLRPRIVVRGDVTVAGPRQVADGEILQAE